MSTLKSRTPIRIALTAGEPAGIGPDLVLDLVQSPLPCDYPVELVVIADPDLLRERAELLKRHLIIEEWEPGQAVSPSIPNNINVLPVKLAAPALPGKLNPANGAYVLSTLQKAGEGCLKGDFAAVVTAPVHKGVINDAGVPFSGHTEFFAELSGSERVVMLLATDDLRVALATTHLPLSQVAAAITPQLLEQTLTIIRNDFRQFFKLENPRILVCGLNPHAGENGHLGREEIDIIIPLLNTLRQQGFDLVGPLPADTLFTPKVLKGADVVLAMYHDQGLPVLKYKGFGAAVNITLGLPFVRTSVDHGTALELAGTGTADPGSMRIAFKTAVDMALARNQLLSQPVMNLEL